ncbi:MAG: hypothetical protein WD576_03675 [Nitriliruptoraceae bacterium]
MPHQRSIDRPPGSTVGGGVGVVTTNIDAIADKPVDPLYDLVVWLIGVVDDYDLSETEPARSRGDGDEQIAGPQARFH